jgi:hypothetical protein
MIREAVRRILTTDAPATLDILLREIGRAGKGRATDFNALRLATRQLITCSRLSSFIQVWQHYTSFYRAGRK